MSVYLDHAATTPMFDIAIDAMNTSLRKLGNPSSLHTEGRSTRKDVEDAREKIAKGVGCLSSEVIFTGSGTEANNAAIKGLFWHSDKKVILISSIEHHAVLDPAHWLVEHEGAELFEIPVDADGVIDLVFLKKTVAERASEIALISVMHSNNETGVIQPIAEVVKIAGDIPVHCDAVQSFTKVALSFKDLGLFAMTISGHKVGGPLGIGALILRRAVEIPALLHGGGQERDIRSGTLNAPSIVALAAAVEAKLYDASKVAELRDSFEAGVLASRPDAVINGKSAPRLPGISNITFPGTQSDSLLLLMDSQKVSCSTGAACTAGVHRPSHVLMAMGLTDVVSQSSLRFSFGTTNTASDVAYALSVLPDVIERGLAANAVGRK
ncbi:cysteine desulfurase [Candidatus Planktophila dulcis]|uniref:Cysteine desulfurase n=1 Tax=Candidatus Planktophila dulcis TaxID=1884914 RepID=A0AAC9YSK3_9ACTN|nr:cysteine desulfurase family protein [Candidatus Planktophila dulcis]ASY11767.1 cysteine desulfurase [Candidatus Planktophila dulcis]ASY21016.1 cysteine desulfurase [Candidatus Planktophila dulcis]